MNSFAGVFNKSGESLDFNNLNLEPPYQKIDNSFYLSSSKIKIFEGSRYLAVFQGRLKNISEILKELKSQDILKCKDSPPEILAHLYEEQGVDAFKKLRGNFAGFIFDKLNKKVIALKDPLGLVPLYYASFGDLFFFSTDISEIVKLYPQKFHVNKNMLIEHLAHCFERARTDTLFKEIKRLEAGHFIDVGPGSTKINKFYTFGNKYNLKGLSDNEIEEEYVRLLRNSVISSLGKKQKNFIQVSGGLDSSSIAFLANEYNEQNPSVDISAISHITPDHPLEDELYYQKMMLEAAPNLKPTFYNIQDNHAFEIFGSGGGYPNFEVEPHPQRSYLLASYKAAKNEGAETLLTGTGADHLMASCWSYFSPKLMRSLKFSEVSKELPYYLKRSSLPKIMFDVFLRDAFSCASSRTFKANIKARSLLKRSPWVNFSSLSRSLATLPFHNDTDASMSVPAKCVLNWALSGWVSNFHATNQIAANFAGLEVEHSYFDTDLVEFLVSLPNHMFFNQGETKLIGKASFKDKLPQQILSRKKTTFSHESIEKGLLSKRNKEIKELINNSKMAEMNILDKQKIDIYYQSLNYGEFNDHQLLIDFINLELWLIDNDKYF